MIDDGNAGRRFSLRRWSARKLASASEPKAEPREETGRASDVAPAGTMAAAEAKLPTSSPAVSAAEPPVTHVASESSPGIAAERLSLPPIDSLTLESDFAPFMRADVEPTLRSAALRKLFADPHFNVMDGLDVYVGDYSKPDPIPPDIVKRLVQARYIFAPPVTRVNAQGVVEDVPEEALAQTAAAATDAAEAPAEPSLALPAATPGIEPVPGPVPPTSDDNAEAAVPGDAEAPRQIALPLDSPPEGKR